MGKGKGDKEQERQVLYEEILIKAVLKQGKAMLYVRSVQPHKSRVSLVEEGDGSKNTLRRTMVLEMWNRKIMTRAQSHIRLSN